MVNNHFEVTLIGRRLKSSISLKRPYSTIRFSLFFNKGFLFYADYNLRLFIFLLFNKFDVYHSNDLDTLLPMWLISSLRKKPIVYDSHEYFLGVPEIQNRFIVKKVWTSIEQFIFPKLQYVFTVNNSIADLYFQDYNSRPNVIRNLPTVSYNSKKESRNHLGLPENKSIVILQGAGINLDRGSEELIEAIASQNKYFLCIVGTGDVIERLKERAKENDLHKKVLFIPPQSYDKMMQYTMNCDVGVSLDKNNNVNYQFSLPNKIFDYSKAVIPFISTNLVEIKKIVEEFQTGVLIKSLSSKDILEGLDRAIELKKSPFFSKKVLKMNTTLNWEKEVEILKATYNSFK